MKHYDRDTNEITENDYVIIYTELSLGAGKRLYRIKNFCQTPDGRPGAIIYSGTKRLIEPLTNLLLSW